MAQFVVYTNTNPLSATRVPYLLDVQSDFVDVMSTRVVVPLVLPDQAGNTMSRLMPLLDIRGQNCVMDTAQIASVPFRMLGKHVVDMQAQRGEILAALDFLISGI